jgi:hypothetical protein
MDFFDACPAPPCNRNCSGRCNREGFGDRHNTRLTQIMGRTLH